MEHSAKVLPVARTSGRRQEAHAVRSARVMPWSTPTQNGLLAALPTADYARLLPDLEFVQLLQGEVVYERGREQHYLYFPTTCVISKLDVAEDGASTEIAVTGHEGVVGIFLFLDSGNTPYGASVTSAGSAYRLKASVLRKECAQGGALQQLMLRYTQVQLTQIAQTAVCSRHHTVEQRLCRRLLMTLDRLPGNELDMTHDLIAILLGSRREGVTQAALKLQAAGLIHYHRGHITVLDRKKLEERVCECYSVVKNEYERLLPQDSSILCTSFIRDPGRRFLRPS